MSSQLTRSARHTEWILRSASYRLWTKEGPFSLANAFRNPGLMTTGGFVLSSVTLIRSAFDLIASNAAGEAISPPLAADASGAALGEACGEPGAAARNAVTTPVAMEAFLPTYRFIVAPL